MINADDILKITQKVTKEWTRQRKAEERSSRSRASRIYIYSDRVAFTDVMNEILPEAYKHASGGRYSVAKRQLYYACREQFKERTDRELEYGYFAGTLLVQFLNRHPELNWKITADPRGTLWIPNAAEEVRVPIGTLDVNAHLATRNKPGDPDSVNPELQREWPSLAPNQRYQGVLYIEKEGFQPLLEEARIAEKYSLAIMSCKGQSTVAGRKFIDHTCGAYGIPLFVVHDCDKAGFEISQRLTQVSDWAEEQDRVSYRFCHHIEAIDLMLRLEDAEEYRLLSEPCEFRGGFARDSICTKREKEFLRSGNRYELNAFTSPQFIECLEAKLDEHLEPFIPTEDILEAAYRRDWVVAKLNKTTEETLESAIDEAKKLTVPEGLVEAVEKRMEDDGIPWDQAVYDEVESKVNPDDKD
jgi:hypothetical protein